MTLVAITGQLVEVHVCRACWIARRLTEDE